MPARPLSPPGSGFDAGASPKAAHSSGNRSGEFRRGEPFAVAEVDLDEPVVDAQGEPGRLDGWRGRTPCAAER